MYLRLDLFHFSCLDSQLALILWFLMYPLHVWSRAPHCVTYPRYYSIESVYVSCAWCYLLTFLIRSLWELTSYICYIYVFVWLAQNSYAHIQDWFHQVLISALLVPCPWLIMFPLFRIDVPIVDVCYWLDRLHFKLLSLDWVFPCGYTVHC